MLVLCLTDVGTEFRRVFFELFRLFDSYLHSLLVDLGALTTLFIQSRKPER
jgi:hypothetical protein